MKVKLKELFSAHKKLLVFIACGVVLSAAVITTVLLYMNQNKSMKQAAAYREYTVEKGDVTVGTTESGTATLEQVNVSFPVEATIDSVAVKPGYTVKSGDALVQLNQASISDGTADTRNKLAQAKLSLEQAISDQSNKLKTAQLTYETSKTKASNAYMQQELTKADIQNNINQASAALKAKQEELSSVQSLQSSFPADSAKLSSLGKNRDDAQSQQNSYQSQLTNYNMANKALFDKLDLLQSTQDAKYSALIYAKSQNSGVDAAQAEYDQAVKAYHDYAAYIKSYIDQRTSLESKVSAYAAQYQTASSDYNSYSQTFTQKYAAAPTAAALSAKIAALQADVKTAQYNLQKAQQTSQTSLTDAQQQLQNSLNTGNSAQSTYDLTVAQLAQAVETQQTTYDSLARQLQQVESAINGDGTITAPCDGVVVAVAYTGGSSVKAGQTIVTIAKTAAVSLSVALSEEDITDVSIGQQAQITLTSLENQKFDASVTSIATSPARTGSASVSYTVTVKMNADNTEKVYEGMSGEVTFIQKQKKDVLYVPNQAITFANGVSSVLVKSADGTQKRRQ